MEGTREGLIGKAKYWEKYAHLGEAVTDPVTGHRRLKYLQEDGTYPSKHLPNGYLVSSRITVYCRYRDPSLNSNTITTNCTSEAILKAVLNAYITETLPGPASIATPEHKVVPFFIDQIDQVY